MNPIGMPRQGSENEHEFKRRLSAVTFCPQTGRRLAAVRYDVTNLGEKTRKINTEAHGEVRALFEEEPENHCSHSSVAEGVLSHVKRRAEAAVAARPEPPKVEISKNFSALEQRTAALPIRKVRKVEPVQDQDEEVTPKLRRVIESVVDARLARTT